MNEFVVHKKHSEILFATPRIIHMLEMALIPIRNVLGAALCKISDTEVIASVLHSDDRQQTELLRVEWHESNHHNHCIYHSGIIQKIFNKHCSDLYERKFVIRLWISPGKNTLECAIDACMLAILDAGIPINNIFVAIQENNELFVFDQKNESVFYLKDTIEKQRGQSNRPEKPQFKRIEETRRKIAFEIENKYQFKF